MNAPRYDGETFTFAGLSFRVSHEYDHDHGAPWQEEDGHGPVSDWRHFHGEPRKYPGERILCSDRGSIRTYDYAEAIKIAKRDGWGLGPDALAKLRARLGHEPTRGEIVATAVDADFNRLRDWCEDRWCYVGVVVTLLDVDGRATNESESLWGIESDAGEYIGEVALELAGEIAGRVGDAREIPARPDRYTIRAAD